MNGKTGKSVWVTFDLTDPLERELYRFLERKTRNVGDLVKHLLFAWQNGWIDVEVPGRRRESGKNVQEIRSSGLPFG
ncbi:hypothetical protein [Staphylospora marina]|uniref:hypothetical protein n=1 Tax=Staphylospora marina TaxID=2490858 RepID=UPI000F5BF860|nr:hypothetical protein [Staphylospora marina]